MDMMEEEHLPLCPDQPTEFENQLSSTQETESTEKLVSQDSSVKSIPDEEFVWEEYLEETQAEAVPPTSFQHVEKSLESGVLEDHLVEVVHSSSGQQPTGYWLAKVVTTCGPLLRLRYVAPSSVTVECWREVAHGGLHPVGWCGHHNIQLSLPSDLLSELVDEGSIKEAKEAVEQAQREGISVPEEALDVEGYTAVDRVKHGMKVEVLFDGNPLCGWVATVMDNVGGRLLLRYDTPDCSGETFWLFYQHPRLRPPDWIHHQGHLWNYSHPTSSTPYEYAEWAALLELSRDDARHSSLPVSLLAPTLGPDTHQFIAGMLLEAVHPFKPYSVHVGKVLEIIDSHFFRIAVDSETSEEISWVTYVNDPLILPWGFCKENNLSIEPPKDWPSETVFDWDTYLRSSTSLCAESEIFKKFESSEDICFSPGLKLEAVDPSAPNQICAATVKETCGHLLVIQLDSEPDSKSIIRASTSQDIFPTGWCQANDYPLKLPAQYSPPARSLENTSMEASQERNIDNSQTTEAVSSGGGSQKSLWCPRLYVNHWCYTGPYLSKSKVAKQSQSVGPGSVELVLREVLAMTINAAYIPTRVLRELERRNGPDPQLISSSWHSIPFKAKFKRYTYTANIPVATTASDISDFLYAICQTLQCCPNLWSSNLTGENCPLLCTSQMSIQGSQTCLRGRGRISINKGVRGGPGTSRIIHRRKRGGRKRLFVPVRANRLLQTKTLTNAGAGVHSTLLNDDQITGSFTTAPSDDISEDVEEEEDAEIEEGEEDDVGSGSDEGDTSSRSSRPTSPLLEHGVGSRRRRRAFPRLEIQTRGVKLPDYATQMKMRQVKKKYEGEASSSASSCREEPLDQKDQMRRDRKNEYPETNSGLEPATVTSDPLEWTVHDVEQYVASQPAICHHAVRLREQEVDGRAFLLLNLPTLVHHLGLPHSSAVALAQHICRVKLAHFLYYYRAEA